MLGTQKAKVVIFSLPFFALLSVTGVVCNTKDMQLTSPAFTHKGNIPKLFTCDGEDISPELMWKDLPEKTKSLVLIMSDPHASPKTYVHWVAFNIDPRAQRLGQNTTPEAPKSLLQQGENDDKKIGYKGPCPLNGDKPHRYYFDLYALDTLLILPANAKKTDLEKAMQGHKLGKAQLLGLYGRSGQ